MSWSVIPDIMGRIGVTYASHAILVVFPACRTAPTVSLARSMGEITTIKSWEKIDV